MSRWVLRKLWVLKQLEPGLLYKQKQLAVAGFQDNLESILIKTLGRVLYLVNFMEPLKLFILYLLPFPSLEYKT